MKKYYLLLFVFIGFNLFAQENSVKIKGRVLHDNKGVQYITVHNLRSNKGVITHGSGIFKLSIKLGDSIHFSSLEYINRVIVISNYHIKNKILYVYLEPVINELNEVFLDKKVRLDFSDLYVAQNMQLDIDAIDLRKPPDIESLVYPVQSTNINFSAIINMITANIRKRKREKKALFQHEEKAKIIFLNNLIDLYGDNYLHKQLKIPADKTYQFIEYCNDKGVTTLYRNDKIKILDFLVKRSVEFNKIVAQ